MADAGKFAGAMSFASQPTPPRGVFAGLIFVVVSTTARQIGTPLSSRQIHHVIVWVKAGGEEADCSEFELRGSRPVPEPRARNG